jgi:CRISPR/Cas system CSM-associated protein Csm3 (group 7 of RAMP superfamily)
MTVDVSQNENDQDKPCKPYDFVSFPAGEPVRERLAGHDRFLPDRYNGVLHLQLTVETALHSSTGSIVLGSDVGASEPLVGPLVQRNGQWIIQGTSLKGCIRSIYEAITNSTLGTKPHKDCRVDQSRWPMKASNDWKNPSLDLCPASRVFGAMGYQGLVEISDAVGDRAPSIVRVMPLHAPKIGPAYKDESGQAKGRKFYHHAKRLSEGGTIPIQVAIAQSQLTAQIHFRNLESADLGALLIALGQDPKHSFALKLGAAKPLGLGTVSVVVTAAEIIQGTALKQNRYLSYVAESNVLQGDKLKQTIATHIQTAHKGLIEAPQLQELAAILKFPGDREPMEGPY